MSEPNEPALRNPADDGTSASTTVAVLEKSATYQDYRAAFQEATGIPLELVAPGVVEERSSCAGDSGTCNLPGEAPANDATATFTCSCGVTYAYVPVVLGHEVLAYLRVGAVKLSPPGRPPGLLRKATFHRRVAPVAFQGTVRMLEVFARHLAASAPRLLSGNDAPTSPLISRVKALVQQRLHEDLSLGSVSRHLRVSTYHLSRVFRQEAGITFTEYIARLRVEHVKQALLNPNLRISEAAYGAGFQSISQFNRVFLRYAGESPTDYVAHLRRDMGDKELRRKRA
jgi:AraC-like DNA-binding protein